MENTNTIDSEVVQTAAEETTPTAETTEQPKKKTAKKDKAEALRQEMMLEQEKLQKQLDESKDSYQRMLAEYANYKRRTEQEKDQIGAFTKAEILKSLLPSIDNMERAMQAPDGEEYKKGIDMTMRAFFEALASIGLTEIEALNAAFDPEVHNAVMREDADGVEPDTVTEVYQKGYKLGDRIIRPAMVKVAN